MLPDFEIRLEDDIPLSSSGKMKQSRNLVRSPYAGYEWDPAELDRAGKDES